MFTDKEGGPAAAQAAADQSRWPKTVVRLPLQEPVELDGDRLVEWVVAEGEIEAQRQIDDAFRALAMQTAMLVDQLHTHPSKLDLALCRRVADGARFAGLPRYAQVAEDVAQSAARGDQVATMAILHRMVRMSAQALRQSWDIARG